ncbi:MAG: hypothetical protein ACXWEY_03270, partial [Bacteroidia bacterium]
STLTLRIFTSSKSRFEEAIIPKWDGVLVHKNYDYNDNPNQIFATIKKNRIIRYGYNNNPFYVPLDKNEEIYLHEIIPVMIEVITENSYSSLHYEVEDNNLHGSYEKMKNKIIFPFNAKSVIENNTLGENQTINRIEIENQDYSTKYFKKYRKFLNPIDPM